ncbi:hypothetical protein CYLTODRAFT_246484 [Cylindrobasidium torrendii FP15055 ss-10]|uniref:C2H2-type domain-containing protein n=1 Tax=Cylindrobasidium torrendii FP15055 ss-10 TaxID=1314674 RepID=A0A0D7BFQ7_9AGAR|nr:hypothetical protein CYLTODRAFT_246484 [Cylindrobasidium torrendii FP15055 ss-10]
MDGYKCLQCDYFAQLPADMNRHVITHPRQHTFICTWAGCAYTAFRHDLGPGNTIRPFVHGKDATSLATANGFPCTNYNTHRTLY